MNNKNLSNDNQLLLSALQEALPLSKLKIQLLEQLTLENAVLSSLSFQNSKITHSVFNKVKFLKCTFKLSSFINNIFSDCSFIECYFNYSSFQDNSFTHSLFERNSFQEVLFMKVSFSTLSVYQCNYEESIFESCQFMKCSISKSSYSRSLFQMTNLMETEFKETEFVKNVFEKSSFNQIVFKNILWDKVFIRKCSFEDPDFILNTFKKLRLRENSGLPEEILNSVLKGKGSLKSFGARCFSNIYFRIFSLILLFNFIFIFMYFLLSPHFFVSRSLIKELLYDKDYNYFIKNSKDLNIALDLIIKPLQPDEELILNDIFKQRKDPRYIKLTSYINTPYWIPNQSSTRYAYLNDYLKNEYLNSIPLWTSLLENQNLIKRGNEFYTWLIDKTLSYDIPSSVYAKIVRKILQVLPSKDRQPVHKSMIYFTMKKQYFDVLYELIESYILIYNPNTDFFNELIVEISKMNYNKSISFKNEIKLLLLSFLKRDMKEDRNYLIDFIKNKW